MTLNVKSLDFEFGKTSFSVASDGVSSSEGEGEGVFAMTRARKRKVESQRDSFLWDVVVNNDDICFKHILPRLNGTDVKFLYGVNTETRKLIKRSSRASDLKETFKVEEMSSISTLEFAWENEIVVADLVGRTGFLHRVAKTNKLELLKWAREEKSVSG